MSERRFGNGSIGLVVGHRGNPREHPENTVSAFLSALAAGADAVELDVRLSRDGQPVVIHDAAVDRTTDGTGLVRELSLPEIRRLRIRGSNPYDPSRVPTLDEALEAVGSVGGGIDIEIKTDPDQYDSLAEPTVRATLGELERTGFSGPVLVSSFDPAVLVRCRELAPEIQTGLLTIEGIDPDEVLAAARVAGHAFILPAVGALLRAGSQLVERAHEADVRVGTWTVDDRDTVRALLGWGVDAIATNDPAMAVATRRALRGS